jgi:hypothetical protein
MRSCSPLFLLAWGRFPLMAQAAEFDRAYKKLKGRG